VVIEASTSQSQRWELYRLLSEPVRLRVLALAAEEELAIGELAELLGESQPNVSRHTAPLKQAGLLAVRRQGTRTLVRVADEAQADPVVADALASGRALCQADGSLARIADVLFARDATTREYFAAMPNAAAAELGSYDELAPYLSALAPLLPERELAIDAGTGDGSFIDVLAPVFDRVVGVDRAEAQLKRARDRMKVQGFMNVELVSADLDEDDAALATVRGQADAVFGVRLLHHAAKPGHVVKRLGELARPGGVVVILDYARHEDEAMRQQADLWLGFEPQELRRFARAAGLEEAHISRVPAPRRGPDAHLPWQVMAARTPKQQRK
jgi:ArsR family transcriptional regulator